MIGFSTISVSQYPQIHWDYIFSRFHYFDITPMHLSLVPRQQVLSLQGIFYGKEMKKASLVKSKYNFLEIKSIFSDILELSEDNGIRSIIWGAPNTRSGMNISKFTAIDRAIELIEMAQKLNIKLYFEALPSSSCEFINRHSELIELHESIGLGGIHYDICSAIRQDEGIDFARANINQIERYHLSEDGFGITVLNNPIAMLIYRYLNTNNIKGTLEVQDYNFLNTELLIEKLNICLND
jgi:hypothetical protein